MTHKLNCSNSVQPVTKTQFVSSVLTQQYILAFQLAYFLLSLFQPCGVDYELRAYIAEECDEKPQSRYVNAFFHLKLM